MLCVYAFQLYLRRSHCRRRSIKRYRDWVRADISMRIIKKVRGGAGGGGDCSSSTLLLSELNRIRVADVNAKWFVRAIKIRHSHIVCVCAKYAMRLRARAYHIYTFV